MLHEWAKVVTQPLGFAAFALFLIFSVLVGLTRRRNRPVLLVVFVLAAVASLGGGLWLASVRVSKSATNSDHPSTQEQSSADVHQRTTGAGSPAVQGVQGNVSVSVTTNQASDGQPKKTDK